MRGAKVTGATKVRAAKVRAAEMAAAIMCATEVTTATKMTASTEVTAATATAMPSVGSARKRNREHNRRQQIEFRHGILLNRPSSRQRDADQAAVPDVADTG
jgi:hypothetical protein